MTKTFKKTPTAQVIADALATITDLPFFELFYAGTHTASCGTQYTFMRADLEQMVTNFNAGTVPFTIEHPQHATASYGYGAQIKLTDDDKLYVSGEKVNVEFAKSVFAGNYSRRSAGIKFNSDKGWYIDHVAWLGATAPALKLKPVGEYTFSQSNDQNPKYIDFEFSVQTRMANSSVRMFSRLRDYFIETLGLEKANAIVDEWDLRFLQEEITQQERIESQERDNSVSAFYNKAPTPKTINEDTPKELTQEQLTAQLKKAAADATATANASFSKQIEDKDKEITTLKTQGSELAYNQRLASANTTVAQLISDGKLLPAQTTGLAEFMANLPVDEASFEFSKKDEAGKTTEQVKTSQAAFFSQFITGLQKSHNLLDNEQTGADTVDMSDATALADKAVAYQKQQADVGLNISVSTAMDHITNQGAK